MELDYGKGAGYIFQWMLSLYIYSLFKDNKYYINQDKDVTNEFKTFRDNILKFKNKCCYKFGDNLNLKIEIMLEGEEKCFEDINLLSTGSIPNQDNYIFIQVKTKGGDNATITKHDGILKAIKNFLANINFQKNKNDNNYLFIIFTNSKLSKLVNTINTHHIDFYISILNEIIKDNNNRKNTKNSNYPNNFLNLIGTNSTLTENLILELLYKNIYDLDINKYNKLYSKDYIEKLNLLIKDIELIVNNLHIVKSIKFDILEEELINIYNDNFYKLQNYFQKLSVNKDKIYKINKDFEIYKNFLFTYFSAKGGGKYINELDSISRGKFVNLD
ncbi:hypothetical protein EOM39_06260 [Candidatus Gracilibacteria bacterium]|nr:hypothetical protein [Candidatus Gracilibacteria bacterium]